MSDFNNIDDLFKGKLQGREAAYSAAAWKGAEGLLTKHYKALLIKKILLITIPTLIAGTIGLAVLFNSTAETSQNLNQDNTVVGTSAIDQTESEGSVIENASMEPATLTSNETSITSETIGAGLPSVSSSSDDATSAQQTPSTDNGIVEVENEIADATDLTTDAQNTIIETPEDNIQESTTDPNVPLPPGFADLLNEMALDEASSSDVGSAATLDNVPTMPIEEANALLNTVNSEMGMMPGFDVSQISNWSTGLADENRASEKLMSKIRKIELMASGGGLIASGMRGNGWQDEKASLGWHAGITVQYFIKEKWFAQTGATIHQRSAISPRRVEWPPFYILPTDVNAPINLRYIDIPLQMGYRLGGRHEVAFGLAFAPLLSYTRTTNVLPTQDVAKYSKDGTSREGFANFDVAALLNYKYQVTERIDLKVEGRFGAFDITDNAYFGTDIVDDRNHQVRLGVSYRIIRH